MLQYEMANAIELQQTYYRTTAQQYDNAHGREPEHEFALRIVSCLVREFEIQSMADIGCGTGRAIQHLHRTNPNVRLVGVEPVDALRAIALNKLKLPPETIHSGSGELLPFESMSLDATCAFGVLHHVREPALVIKEMMRVSRVAIFLSDSNRFGQGSTALRRLKLLLYRCGLWPLANLAKTKGKGYSETEGDGISYSYSVYDSYPALARWANRILMIPTQPHTDESLFHPLLTSGHVLLCALKT